MEKNVETLKIESKGRRNSEKCLFYSENISNFELFNYFRVFLDCFVDSNIFIMDNSLLGSRTNLAGGLFTLLEISVNWNYIEESLTVLFQNASY